jgi:hypothetical protein
VGFLVQKKETNNNAVVKNELFYFQHFEIETRKRLYRVDPTKKSCFWGGEKNSRD